MFGVRYIPVESILVSTVHDSLLVDAKRDELPQIHEIVDYVMNNIPEVMTAIHGDDFDLSWCQCPLAGDSELCLNYLEMKGVENGPDNDWDKLLAELESS